MKKKQAERAAVTARFVVVEAPTPGIQGHVILHAEGAAKGESNRRVALQAAIRSLRSLIRMVKAVTASRDEGFVVPDACGAIALSEAASAVMDALADLMRAAVRPHDVPIPASSLPISLSHSDRPGEEGSPIGETDVVASLIPVGGSAVPVLCRTLEDRGRKDRARAVAH